MRYQLKDWWKDPRTSYKGVKAKKNGVLYRTFIDIPHPDDETTPQSNRPRNTTTLGRVKEWWRRRKHDT